MAYVLLGSCCTQHRQRLTLRAVSMPGISVMVIPNGENFISTSGGCTKDMSMPLMPGARENRCKPMSMRPLMLKCVTATLPETRGSRACALIDGAICNWEG